MDLKKKLQEVAAKTKGGSPEGYDTGAQGVIRKGGGLALTWAQAAEAAIKLGGIYDGTETPKEINAMTKAAAAAHKGRGLMGVARDNLPRDGQTYGFMAAFAEVEVDVETGVWTIVDFIGRRRRRHRDSPELSSAARSTAAASRASATSAARSWSTTRTTARACRRACITTSRRRFSTCRSTRSGPRSACPIRPTRSAPRASANRRRSRRRGAVLCALADAVGDDIIRRTPVQPEHIAAALANGRKPMMHNPLQAFI